MTAFTPFARRLLAAAATTVVLATAFAAPTSASTSLAHRTGGISSPEGEQLTVLADKQAPIKRSAIRVRGKSWIDEKVLYNKMTYHRNKFGNYRTDCSGFGSMAWGLNQSYRTATMHLVSHKIEFADMKPGDAFLRATNATREGHFILFMGWTDEAQDEAIIWHNTDDPVEGEGRDGTRAEIVDLEDLIDDDMHAIRRNDVIEDTDD